MFQLSLGLVVLLWTLLSEIKTNDNDDDDDKCRGAVYVNIQTKETIHTAYIESFATDSATSILSLVLMLV